MVGDRGKLSSALPLKFFKIISTKNYASNSIDSTFRHIFILTWFLEIVTKGSIGRKFPWFPHGSREKRKEERKLFWVFL